MRGGNLCNLLLRRVCYNVCIEAQRAGRLTVEATKGETRERERERELNHQVAYFHYDFVVVLWIVTHLTVFKYLLWCSPSIVGLYISVLLCATVGIWTITIRASVFLLFTLLTSFFFFYSMHEHAFTVSSLLVYYKRYSLTILNREWSGFLLAYYFLLLFLIDLRVDHCWRPFSVRSIYSVVLDKRGTCNLHENWWENFTPGEMSTGSRLDIVFLWADDISFR